MDLTLLAVVKTEVVAANGCGACGVSGSDDRVGQKVCDL